MVDATERAVRRKWEAHVGGARENTSEQHTVPSSNHSPSHELGTECVSGSSERANARASGLIPTSKFLADFNHSEELHVSGTYAWNERDISTT